MIRSAGGRVKGACVAAARALRAPMTRPPARRTGSCQGQGARLMHPRTSAATTTQTPKSDARDHRQMQVRRFS